MKKTIFFLAFLQIISFTSKACDCANSYFCSLIKDTSSRMAIEARVIAHKNYGMYNQAVYLQVIKKYKDELSITDTIKIYGSPNEAACAVNVAADFSLGSIVFLAFSHIDDYAWDGPIVNPDAGQENFSEFKPLSCNMVLLRVEEGIVVGAISEGVYNYPLGNFLTALQDCNYPPIETVEYKCPEVNYTVFPNPSPDGRLHIRSEFVSDYAEKIRVFSIEGRLIHEYSGLRGGPVKSMEIDRLGSGIYVLEITCGGRIYYKKVLVM
ncbi:MAG TPA: T9SS type A sorting domain-containing protein [Saprospiraceae bacterium]|nr:T9SS type A sorting domain-containing protein [Saprospiraceae bacterium]HPI07267.1 T9SS type A sorting domain-containing protein [Saprospiraceae bacterium]